MFWILPPPIGILNVTLTEFIDETAVFLETVNRSHGKAYIGARVREPGNYGHSEKWTLILAIGNNFKQTAS